MRINKKIIAAATIPVLVAGWALFRPELLFVNQRVSDSAPVVAGVSNQTLASGTFTSGAHETAGKAELIRAGDKSFVRLSGFHTSNGPDVRIVLLGKGVSSETDKGAIDLGSLKGNIGDQNYELPQGVSAEDIERVSIWCKRFNVGFGEAELTKSTASRLESSSPYATLVAFEKIRVTFGKTAGNPAIAGNAEIFEDSGKRFVNLNFKKIGTGDYEVKLLKKETIGLGTLPAAEPIELGKLTTGSRKVAISKEIDAWLYRSIAIVNTKTGKIDAFILLRSEQELKKNLLLA